ncbi:MAG: hypothetical protein NZ872_06085 [Archaeoglobaceae archaeon]|nr:hypothetical protein [Archaeoglobaceae archaeon]MDW8128769.1 hypothetical protein [Archaeoglobaceae archaeon]
MMKRNPGISEETLLRRIRKLNIKRSFIMLFSVFLFLGILIAYSYPDQSSLKLSIALFLFLSSIFMTSVSLQQTTAVGIFEPLRALPISGIEKQISILFLIDSLAILGIAVPSIALIAFQDPLNAFIYFCWLIFAILFGHIIGMTFLAIFGVKIARKSRLVSKALFFVFLLLLILIMIPELFSSEINGEITEISNQYYFLYPFTVLCDFQKSFILLIIYFSILIPINIRVSKSGVKALFEPKFEKTDRVPFKVSSGGKMVTLVLKDLKLIYRHPSGLLGILLPFLLLAPQILVIASISGGNAVVIQAISTVSLFSPIILGLITRGEGKEIDFLRILPITKNEFLLGKVITTAFIVCSSSVALTAISCFFGATFMAFPIAFLLPTTISLFSAVYLFNYPSNEPGIPEMGIRRMAILFILCTVLTALLMTPMYIFTDHVGYALTFFFSLILLAVMFRKVRN